MDHAICEIHGGGYKRSCTKCELDAADNQNATLRAHVAELEASVKRHQEWLQQKSNEKVEALQERDICLVEKERLADSDHNLRQEIKVLTQERDRVEKAARALLSRRDFWISAATLMALPGELDNLAEVLVPGIEKGTKCAWCGGAGCFACSRDARSG